MGRRYAAADYARAVERVRAAIPGVAIHADVIAGFPSEDDDAFARTRAFLGVLDPAGLHVFRYSARPGTPAARMAGQVPDVVRKERAALLLDDAAAARRRFAARAGERAGRSSSRSPSTRATRLPAGSATPRTTWWCGPRRPDGRSLAGEIGIVDVRGDRPGRSRARGRADRPHRRRPSVGPAAGRVAPRTLPVVPFPA